MYLSRRQFLQISGATAAVAGLGAGLVWGGGELRGKVAFADWRALPGMLLGLRVDVEHPEDTEVTIIAESEGVERVLERRRGSAEMEVEIPCIETSQESYFLYALVEDGAHRVARSQRVEVLSQPFMFGL